jgi:hypothetical protein
MKIRVSFFLKRKEKKTVLDSLLSKPCGANRIRDELFMSTKNCLISVHLAKQFQRRFLETNQPETRFACGSHVCKWIGAK